MSRNSSGSSSPDGAARAAAVIVAGGTGQRMGGVRKQFLELRGRPVLHHAIEPFLSHPDMLAVVVVLPPDIAPDPPTWLRELPVRVVAGGAERGDSVWNGLCATPVEAEVVLIHDGARPLVSREVIDRVLAAVGDGAAIAAVPVTDTIKEVDASGRIVGTPDRSRLWQAQTPQGFRRAVILEAHRRARADGIHATDDAVLVERLGLRVRVVAGAAENLKITRPADLRVADALASHPDTG